MVFGEDSTIWMERVVLAVSGLVIGLLWKIWEVAKSKRDQDVEISGKRQNQRAKDVTLERAGYDFLAQKYEGMLDKIQIKVDKLEADNRECETKAARLDERCSGLETRNEEMETEIGHLRSRVRELETANGV